MKISLDTIKTIVSLTPIALDLVAEISKISGASTMPRYLDTVANIIRQGDAAIGELEKFTELMQVMVTEGREPSDSEWSTLKSRADIAYEAVLSTDLDSGD